MGNSTKLCLALVLALITIIAVEGSEKALKEVSASEVLAKIETGQPIEYDHVIVTGNLDLSMLNLPTRRVDIRGFEKTSPGVLIVNTDLNLNKYVLRLPKDIKVVRSAIRMSNSKIMGIVDFSNTILEDTINFQNVVFNNDVHFQNTEFNSTDIVGCQFDYVRFNGSADFSLSKFNNTVLFGYSTFNRDVEFWNARFNKDAYFLNSDFNQGAEFHDTQFHRLGFYMSKFNSDVHFENCEFTDYAGLSSCMFNKDIYFDNSNFDRNAVCV